MKRHLAIIALFLISISLNSSNHIRVLESCIFYSQILRQEVKYSVILPEAYFRSNRNFPVVYLLHGLGDDETTWIENGQITQIADKLTKAGEIKPTIFVMPQGFRSYYVNTFDQSFLYQDMFISELIPHIDKNFRTLNEKQHRAVLGYSMGGYGALILPMKHPDKFIASVPMSISIRTDAQYKTENPAEWDVQWGSIFGGVGQFGEPRLTEYYKQNNPFHLISANQFTPSTHLKLYIDIGDDEQTLAISNEELHILLRDKQISHEYRVRNGGHDFSYWRDALLNGLRFINNAFENKDFHDRFKHKSTGQKLHKKPIIRKSLEHEPFEVSVPPCYLTTDRSYPVVFLVNKFSTYEKELVAGRISQLITDGQIPPILLVFIGETDGTLNAMFVTAVENEFRVRKNFRFRAIIGLESGAEVTLLQAIATGQFGFGATINGNANMDLIQASISKADLRELEKTWFYFEAPDKGANYDFNGKLHMQFREKKIYHEYRVSQGSGDFAWTLRAIESALSYATKKFYK